MKSTIPALAFAAACLLPSTSFAQAKPTDVYVSVVDGKGEPAHGLAAEDFRVREDGAVREVLEAGPATEPLTVALLVDDTQAASSGLQMLREAVLNFITALDGKAEISIVTFGERPTIAVDYTTDQKRLIDGAKRIFPRTGAGSYLLDAIVDVSKGMQKRKPKRPVVVVLLVEEGVEFSNRHYDNVLAELDKGGAALHVAAIGQPNSSLSDEIRNRNQVIAEGTQRTGGRRDQVLAVSAAPAEMSQIARDLLNQYVVTYVRPDTLIPPEKIEVTVTRAGLTARARTRTGQVGSR
jgi:VWFA-related protein